jgi:hypothetical protein
MMHQSSPAIAIIATVLAAGCVAMLAAIHSKPAIPAVKVPEISSKGDMEHHIRIIPITRPEVVDAGPPQPVIQPVEPPRIYWPADPAVHKTQPVAQNICERTGGRKVETNSGRSWHCEYNHRN